MRLTIERTDRLTSVDGVECRVWNGRTDDGVLCLVLVHRIVVREDNDCGAFEAALVERPRPANWPERGLPADVAPPTVR